MLYLLRFMKKTVGSAASTFLSAVLLLGCLGMATGVTAQSTTSTITGYVSDSKGAVPDAVVTVVHMPTHTSFYAITNSKGNFTVSHIIAGGPYTVKVERINHNTAIVQEIMAPVAEATVVDVVLTETSMQLDEVTIYSSELNSSMNINRSGAGIHLNTKAIEAVPTVRRSLNDVLKLTPQCVELEGVSIGGGNYRGSAVSVDGATFNNSFGIGSNLPAGGTPISIDAIDQIDVNITPFNVRQSGFLGAAINMITKRGTNIWHGSVYDYFTGSMLQGKKVGDDLLTTSRTLNNVTGFTLGGPIVKNKLFFFLNGEYTVDQQAGSTVQARPDGDSDYGGSTGFNRPTVTQMDAISQFLSEQFGYNPGRYQNFSPSSPDYRILARLDWHINASNTFQIRLSHTHTSEYNTPSSSMSPLGGDEFTIVSEGISYTVNRRNAGRTSQYAMPFESASYLQNMNFTTLAAELNSRVLEGQGNNVLRVTWSLQHEPRSYVGGSFPTVDILEPYTDASGNQQMAMYTTFGPDPFTYGNLRRVNTATVTDEFVYQKDIHTILAGAQVEWNSIKNGFMQGGAGWYVYDSWQSFVNDVNGVEGAGPSLFMITHANSDNPTEQVFPTITHSQISVYAQDDMEISKFFKLTAGLRLEMPFLRFRYDNRNVGFDEVAAAHPNSSFAGRSTADVPAFDFHISPRVGFNWDITHDRKVVLRGGTGLFTGRIPNVWLVSAAGNSNCLQYQYIANTTTGLDVVRFNEDREEIINSIYSGHGYNSHGLPAPTNATILAKNLHMPTSWKTSLALDFNIPGDFKITVEGIYSYNLNEIYASMLGYKEDGTIQLPGEPDARTRYVSEGICNKAGAEMHGYYLHNEMDLHGQYFSATLQLAKNFRFGLDLMAAYTYSYSTSLSDGAGDQVSSFANTPNVHDCNRPELGFSGYVAPHRVVGGLGYTIQEGQHTATKLGLFYEGFNIGVYNERFSTRRSYLIDNVSGLTSPQLIYIPTSDELAQMPFATEQERADFESFIVNDPYLSKHRGEYSKRNGGLAPWLNRINFKVAQEFIFNVIGQRHSVEVGLDLNNVANLFNSKWGAVKALDNDVVLSYKDGKYSFTPSTWSSYNNLASTWQILVHVRYKF